MISMLGLSKKLKQADIVPKRAEIVMHVGESGQR